MGCCTDGGAGSLCDAARAGINNAENRQATANVNNLFGSTAPSPRLSPCDEIGTTILPDLPDKGTEFKQSSPAQNSLLLANRGHSWQTRIMGNKNAPKREKKKPKKTKS